MSQTQVEYSSIVLSSAVNNQPCYFGLREGILSCHNCRAKFVCDKSPERKL
jgi:hypothetical protein